MLGLLLLLDSAFESPLEAGGVSSALLSPLAVRWWSQLSSRARAHRRMSSTLCWLSWATSRPRGTRRAPPVAAN